MGALAACKFRVWTRNYRFLGVTITCSSIIVIYPLDQIAHRFGGPVIWSPSKLHLVLTIESWMQQTVGKSGAVVEKCTRILSLCKTVYPGGEFSLTWPVKDPYQWFSSERVLEELQIGSTCCIYASWSIVARVWLGLMKAVYVSQSCWVIYSKGHHCSSVHLIVHSSCPGDHGNTEWLSLVLAFRWFDLLLLASRSNFTSQTLRLVLVC